MADTAILPTEGKPVRLQLRRTKGFNLQALSRATNGLPAIAVTRAGPLGNPFVVGVDGTREDCCMMFAHLLSGRICLTSKATVESQKRLLKTYTSRKDRLVGYNLACSCRFDGKPCHAGIYLICCNLSRETYVQRGLLECAKLLAAASTPEFLIDMPAYVPSPPIVEGVR